MEDYSNFSWEAIEKDIRDMVAEVQQRTGATDEEINAALAVSARKVMDTNGFLL